MPLPLVHFLTNSNEREEKLRRWGAEFEEGPEPPSLTSTLLASGLAGKNDNNIFIIINRAGW